jgi:serine protease Do
MRKKTLLPVSMIMAILLGCNLPSFLTGHMQEPPAQPRDGSSYREVIKRVLPAVVSIEAKNKSVARRKNASPRWVPEMPGLPDELRRFFDESQLPFEFGDELPPMHGYASGFVIDSSGVILTNHHVVKGAEKITVEFQDGRTFVAKEIRSDPKSDLAIILIDAKNLPVLELGDSDQMEIGDRVLAVGAPFGLAGSVTSGIVSGKGRNMQMNMYEDYVQTDAAINPGNSGGPLVNLDGKVIGINTAIKTRTGGWQGIGLAIASNLVKNVWPQLQKGRQVHRGYLGIQARKLAPDVASHMGVPNNAGVVVGRVYENTPASKAGLKAGDVLTTIAGKQVTDGQQVQRIVTELPTGKPVDLVIFRDGKPMTLSAVIETQPTEYGLTSSSEPLQHGDAEGVSLESLGIKVADMTPERASQFGFKKDTQGAVITYVEPGSLTAEAGVERGSLILKVDKKPVSNAQEAQAELGSVSLNRGVLLQLQTPHGGIAFVLIKSDSSK